MTAPLPKRRKLDSTSALLKPFKPPSRNPASSATPSLTRPSANPTTRSPAPKPAEPRNAPSTAVNPATPKAKARTTTSAAAPSPELAALRARATALRNRLAAVRAELSAKEEALRIERATGRAAELEELTARWRGAARAAAEELYGGARDRVNGMGGVGAWRAREKEKRERWAAEWGPQREEGDGREGDGGGEEERAVDEEGEGGGQEEQEAENEDDEKGFTMDLMLKSLNIELDVIGYDPKMQRWVD